MKTLSALLLVSGLALLISGCASSKLTLKLDIYGEDPNVAYLTLEQLDAYQRALNKAPEDIKDYARDRRELAWRIYQLYESGFRLRAGEPPSSAELRSVAIRVDQWKAYTNELSGLTETAIQTTHEAARTVNELRSLIDRPELKNQELRRANDQRITRVLNQVIRVMNQLARPMTNALEKGLVNNFDAVRSAFTNRAKNEKREVAWKKLLDEINELDKEIRRLARKGSANMVFLSNALDQAVREARKTPEARRTDLHAALEEQTDKAAGAIEVWMETSGGAPSPTTNLASRIASLTPAGDHSDLDRHQDPADPVWRILADPRNYSKWHTAFTTNYFYSEGNNSVVIVRDSPIHYRVHSADNNPTALIEGQLRISRALTDAALQIAGTAAGVKMPDLKGKPSLPPPTAPEPSGAAPGSTPAPVASEAKTPPAAEDANTASVATAEATIDAEIANRNATFRTLSRSLVALGADFERHSTNEINRANLLGQLESVLKAYSILLKPADSKPAAKANP